MLQISVNEQASFDIAPGENGGWKLNGAPADIDLRFLPDGRISVLYKGRSYTAYPEPGNDRKEWCLTIGGRHFRTAVKDPTDQLLERMGMDLKAGQKAEPVKAPMPGMVLRVLVEPGQQVAKGDGLVILEAMKMENVLKASHAGTVKAVRAVEKTAVEKGVVLIEME